MKSFYYKNLSYLEHLINEADDDDMALDTLENYNIVMTYVKSHKKECSRNMTYGDMKTLATETLDKWKRSVYTGSSKETKEQTNDTLEWHCLPLCKRIVPLI